MPVWMDILLNVIGYAGFVGVATFNHAPEQAAETGGENVNSFSAAGPRCA
jgi:hypothetical protein